MSHTPDTPRDELSLDEIGPWSIRKNDMVEYYASIYAGILGTAKAKFRRFYIDGFSNRGLSRLKGTEEIVRGSALRVLGIQPPFDGYYFVEQDEPRAADLSRNIGAREDVRIIVGDANLELVNEVFPNIRYDQYERALCFLDPYNMRGLRWETILAAGNNRAIEAIIHFPTMDAHRTVLPRNPNEITPTMRQKMTTYWGDESWREIAYTSEGLLPLGDLVVKREPETIIEAFRTRLRDIAGFDHVSLAMPMRNRSSNIIYHLVFASHNPAAAKVMRSLEKRFGEM